MRAFPFLSAFFLAMSSEAEEALASESGAWGRVVSLTASANLRVGYEERGGVKLGGGLVVR